MFRRSSAAPTPSRSGSIDNTTKSTPATPVTPAVTANVAPFSTTNGTVPPNNPPPPLTLNPPATPVTPPSSNNNTSNAAANINNAGNNSRRESFLPDALHLATIGIESHPEDRELDEAPRLEPKDCMDPAVTADRLNRLTEIVQELNVKSRDNNSILCQMLFMMEERFNKRLETVREELIQIMDRKFQVLATELQTLKDVQSVPVNARRAGSRNSSAGFDRNHSATSTISSNGLGAGLSGLFDPVDIGETASVTSRASSLAIPKVPTPRNNNNDSSNNNDTSDNNMIVKERPVTPIPGFAIKTRKMIGEKEKIFINVFHHELIEVIPFNLPKNISADQKPFLLFGTVTHSLDSNGHNCSTYNIGVSSEYFKPDSTIDLKITAPSSVQKIIHKVNLKYNEFFDENSYSLPRLSNGFKGDDIPLLTIPVLVPKESPTSYSFKGSSFPDAPPPSKKTERVSFAENDDESVVSEISMRESDGTPIHDSDAARRPSGDKKGGKKMARKSIFDTRQLAINAGNIAGRNLLSGNMCEYIKEESLPGSEAEQLKEASIANPYKLLGWQISLILDNGETEIFVVTDVRKNYLGRTEFRLSRFYQDDLWVRLKRGEGKSGSEFRPLRKVLFGLKDDDDDTVT